MAENTKTPPNQDRPRTPQGDANKPQKPGGMPGSDPDRGRQGVNNPNKPEIDPDRDHQNRGKPMALGRQGGDADVDDLDDDDSTKPMERK